MRNKDHKQQEVPIILIVDDMPDNLRILGELLKDNGYKVRPVPNGKLALQVTEKEKPDLILLDIMMPDMDGFEVCRRLKASKNLSEIPVIFISALNDTKNIVKAFNAGGIDYISKPFQAEEVTARVATHLEVCWQKNELQRLNAEKDKFFSIIAHDLRNPFGGFMALTQMLVDDEIDFAPEELKAMLLELSLSAANIYELLNDLLEWSQVQRGNIDYNPQLLEAKIFMSESLRVVKDMAAKKQIVIKLNLPDEHQLYGDLNMLQTVVRNLVSNAIKFTPHGGEININSHINHNEVTVSINDNGIGMAPDIVNNLFVNDSRTRRPGTEGEPSSGLGLMLCKEFIEKHNGKIWVESIEGKGSSFSFSLPFLTDLP